MHRVIQANSNSFQEQTDVESYVEIGVMTGLDGAVSLLCFAISLFTNVE